MECRVATTCYWEWGTSTLQRLSFAQALRVYIYIYIYNYIYLYIYVCIMYSKMQRNIALTIEICRHNM